MYVSSSPHAWYKTVFSQLSVAVFSVLQHHVIFGEGDLEAEGDLEDEEHGEHEEMEFDEPIPEEDEEDEEMFRDSADILPPKLPAEPPILSINLGSPASLSFNIP